MSDRWVPSRFNAQRTVDGNLMLFNSFTGGILMVPPGPEQEQVRGALRGGHAGSPDEVTGDLVEAGMLVPASTDEFLRARMVKQVESHPSDVLHLTVLPTEACNLRCVYCYEEYRRGAMSPAVVEGLKRYVAKQVRRVNVLSVSWFGGEPLMAPDVMRDLSLFFLDACQQNGVQYAANCTTNAYLLTPDLLAEVLAWQIKSLQITLDGPAATHDCRRKRSDGAGTFDQILANLTALAATDADISVILRVNYDTGVLERIDELLDTLASRFGNDERFTLWPRPISDWGGPNSGSFATCTPQHIWPIMEKGIRRGLSPSRMLRNMMKPHGSVCYAANPHSMVVGADGTVYKCTVALTDERNHVGRLLPDGTLDLDMDRLALWVTQDPQLEEKCFNCYLQPSCQGKSCPLANLNQQQAVCAGLKKGFGNALKILALDALQA